VFVFDESMVLLKDIVQIFDLANFNRFVLLHPLITSIKNSFVTTALIGYPLK